MVEREERNPEREYGERGHGVEGMNRGGRYGERKVVQRGDREQKERIKRMYRSREK